MNECFFDRFQITDGSGNASFMGGVLVSGDRIAAVVPCEAKEQYEALKHCVERVITARPDEYLTPGFVDAHAHSDAYLVIEPSAPSKITQGVTTEINGQCGGSVAPRYGEARLSSDWASILGERLTWHSLAEYREVLAAAKPALNTIQFIGHNTLRSSVMGYVGRRAQPEDLVALGKALEQGLDEGAWGLTTGLIYQPGLFSTPDEVEFLARLTAKRGGFYATHMRSEGDRILEAIDEVLELVKKTGVKAEISHLKTAGARNWHKIDAVLEKVGGAVEDGLLLGSDRYPYCAAGTDLDVVFPDWAGEGAAKAECVRLADPATRARIVEAINACGRDWATVMIGGTWSDETRRYSGRYLSEILVHEGQGLSAGEMICRILAADQCRTGAFFFGMSEENLAKIYSQPWIVPGSDASIRAPWAPLGNDYPHPRAYATMPEFYRRVRALGFSHEETVARMTSVPAHRFEIPQRGEIKEGNFADFVVWSPNAFKGRSTYANPHAYTEGVRLVMVNGVTAYRDGAITGDRGGRFLTRA